MLSKSEVKYIQSLRQKKFRQQENVFIAEGPKIIGEALHHSAAAIKKIFATPAWVGSNPEAGRRAQVAVISEDDLQRISALKTPHQVLAVMEQPLPELFVLKTEQPALVLDSIQDPGNMGTILRIADWFGLRQIICSPDSADIYNTKVVQASMGSIFRTEVLYADLPQWIPAQQCLRIYGAALHGKNLCHVEKIKNGLLVIGNESKGISPALMKLVDEKITIEKKGQAESLNAAVAAGIILSHIL